MLPEPMKLVLVCHKDGFMHTDYIGNKSTKRWIQSYVYGMEESVVAWQPLPGPYIDKEDKDAN